MTAAIAVPVLVAFIGAQIQRTVAETTTAKDYVQIAVTILQQQGGDPDLKAWAADVLVKYAPIPLTPGLKAKISTGKLPLPPGVLPSPPQNLKIE